MSEICWPNLTIKLHFVTISFHSVFSNSETKIHFSFQLQIWLPGSVRETFPSTCLAVLIPPLPSLPNPLTLSLSPSPPHRLHFPATGKQFHRFQLCCAGGTLRFRYAMFHHSPGRREIIIPANYSPQKFKRSLQLTSLEIHLQNLTLKSHNLS